MLVFVSDLHLTDASFRPAIPIKRLTDAVDGVIERGRLGGVTSVKVVLLGDIFEIIKSPEWLAANVRPWEPVTEAHRKTVTTIFRSIAAANQPFFSWLAALPTRFPFVSFCYIPGNHDLALNTAMGEEARRELRAALSHAATDAPFEAELADQNHRVLARHGHEWDANNRAGARGGPFGDAIVVEVLLRLPLRMAQILAMRLDDEALAFLSELDNVRPQLPGAMARWLQSGLIRLCDRRRDAEAAFDEVFNEILTTLMRLGKSGVFEAYRYASWWSRSVAWGATKVARRGGIHRLMHLFPLSEAARGHYPERVRDLLRVGEHDTPRFFLCGHTHVPEHVPLTSGARGVSQSVYMNTGTWRRVHSPVDLDRPSGLPSFTSHQEECLVAVYDDAEQALGLPSYEYHRVAHGID